MAPLSANGPSAYQYMTSSALQPSLCCHVGGTKRKETSSSSTSLGSSGRMLQSPGTVCLRELYMTTYEDEETINYNKTSDGDVTCSG